MIVWVVKTAVIISFVLFALWRRQVAAALPLRQARFGATPNNKRENGTYNYDQVNANRAADEAAWIATYRRWRTWNRVFGIYCLIALIAICMTGYQVCPNPKDGVFVVLVLWACLGPSCGFCLQEWPHRQPYREVRDTI